MKVLLVAVFVLGFIRLCSVMACYTSAPAAAAAPAGCSASDFSISKVKARTEYDYAHVTGIVKNNCHSAVGVQLKWTAYNSDGSVAFSEDFWPASTTNIPSGASYPFEYMNTAPRGKWTFQVEPIALNHW